MLILLSPAKTLDLKSPFNETLTTPRFAHEAATLAGSAARLGPKRLADLMGISPALAELTHQRFREFSEAEERPAIRMFGGDVYRGFDVSSADEDTLAFAQAHLRILSGLYGLLRPLDAVRPYRLEMGTAWAPRSKRLVDYWGRRIAPAVKQEFADEGSGLLLNLASAEYFAAVKPFVPKAVRTVTPDFRVEMAAGLKFHSFTAKVARGSMARFVCEERLEDAESLRAFDRDGWRFDKRRSAPDAPLFVRS
jgi:cytoplasmic iron level regulating protein YaaA (DUF328/UPF0246 family)